VSSRLDQHLGGNVLEINFCLFFFNATDNCRIAHMLGTLSCSYKFVWPIDGAGAGEQA